MEEAEGKIATPICPYCKSEMEVMQRLDYWGDAEVLWCCDCEDEDLIKYAGQIQHQ